MSNETHTPANGHPDNSHLSDAGLDWARVGFYTLCTMAIWTACWFVTAVVVRLADLTWIRPEMPGAGFAVICAIAWEVVRRERARRRP